jgi:putative superfamily III holin-X
MEKPLESSSPKPILDDLKAYAETNFKLAKYELIDKSSSVVADVTTDLIFVISLSFVLFFASVTLGYYLGLLLDAEWKGFGAVTMLYLVIALTIGFFKKELEKPIINRIIQKLLR